MRKSTERAHGAGSLGEKLRSLLYDSGHRQIDLAKYVGVSQGNVADHLAGRSYPTFQNVVRYAAFFGVTLYDLTGLEDLRHVRSAPDGGDGQKAVTAYTRDLMRSIDSLPPKHREAVEKVILAILDRKKHTK